MPAITSRMVDVVVLAQPGPRVLVVRRSERETLPGAWCFVSGGIHDGERAWETALRELAEEAGIVPSALYSADHVGVFYAAELDEVVAAVAFVAIADSDAVTLDDEHDACEWLSFDDARARVSFPGLVTLLDHVERHFVKRPPAHWLRLGG